MSNIAYILENKISQVVLRGDTDATVARTQNTEGVLVSTAAPDFARLLFNLLEHPTHQDIVCWGPSEDYFVIKNSNEFESSILPRILNHSSITSFARRLNRYGFDKLKKAEVDLGIDHTWAFQHISFRRDRPEDLHNITVTRTALRTSTSTSSGSLPGSSDSNAASSSSLPCVSPSSKQDRLSEKSNTNSNSNSDPVSFSSNDYGPSPAELKADIESLKTDGEDLRNRAHNLERTSEDMIKSIKRIEKEVELRGRTLNNFLKNFALNMYAQEPSYQSPMVSPVLAVASELSSTFTAYTDPAPAMPLSLEGAPSHNHTGQPNTLTASPSTSNPGQTE